MAIKQNALIFLFLFLISCSGKKDGGNAQSGIFLKYVDGNGSSLFSTLQDGQNGYWLDSVKVYDLTDGRKTTFPPCIENALAFSFEGGTGMHVCPNNHVINRYSTTLIHVKNGMDDTLRVHIDQNSITPAANTDSIWYNGTLKFRDSAFIKVIK